MRWIPSAPRPESQRSIENLEEVFLYPACEVVLSEEELRDGVEKIKKEAKRTAEKFRKEMKTEEAYRVQSLADQIAEETTEYGNMAGLDAFLSYFCEERVSLLDYLDSEILLFFWRNSAEYRKRTVYRDRIF